MKNIIGISVAILLTLLAFGCAPTKQQYQTGTWYDHSKLPPGTDTTYYPIYVPNPLYPANAVAEKVDGYAVVEVTVSIQGEVTSAKLLEEHPKGWGFGRVSLSAAPKLRYNPRIVDGKAVEMHGVLYKFTYRIQP
ncbi:MAG: energy transducer TonB [Porticoccaceae bacterium]|nr:energy transducer TonB [Pseudomonadales bacterium]MCP5170831.1 energy transducer TonB [Pseudomonadales bacterium]MCP5301929.1 energy transducer TonB [Pseudomonadales bacterium]